MTENFYRKALDTAAKYNMLCDGDRVVIAVSGGADSMALLDFFINIRDKYNLELCAAHVEHGIRGKESLADADFVSRFCRENNIKLYTKSINAVLGAKDAGLGVEEFARKARYDFFSALPCDKIATAHSLTDNIETVLFRLARGTGLKGTCGIPPVRGNIIRPFIELTSQEIRAHCREQGIEYRIDSTNADEKYSRNFIRNSVLPSFERLNPDFQANFKSFITDVNADEKFIDDAAQAAYDRAVCGGKIDTAKINEFPDPIKKRVIKKYFELSGITLDRAHLVKALELTEKSGKYQLRGNSFAVSAGGFLRSAELDNTAENKEFITKILNYNEFNANDIDFYCDCDKIIGSARLRARMAGDSIKPAGRGCTKSLKKLFNEYNIPLERRADNIVVADDKGVIGVVGCCADERVKPDGGTEKIFAIKYI